MVLSPGAHLGRYEILSPLGAGGMGEVYRARDSRLQRDVAIKILPERLASDPVAMKYFEREAKALAALFHPNILAIHDFGVENGISFAVTDLLEGTSLREMLTKEGRPAWRRAAEIAIATADGLTAAHDKGIIHRDLKPENIFITKDDRVIILDFGLARFESRLSVTEASHAATKSLQTQEGALQGTVPYMSPEQLQGMDLDARTDVFSFGCVLYEMLTGQRAFARNTSVETIAAILKEEPVDFSLLKADVPEELEDLTRRCLEKNREKRIHSAHDLAFMLRRILGGPASMKQSRRKAALPSFIWILLLMVIAFIFGYERIHKPEKPAGAGKIQSLAVLPLENLSGDSKQEYFADGMTDELITELAKVSSMKVISRTSSLQYKGTKKSTSKIAKELGVDALIEGSVLAEGDQVRITVQLIHAATDRHLWAQSYQRQMRSVLTLQSEMARAIVHELETKVSPQEQHRLAVTREVNPAAHEAYLKGRYYMQRIKEEALERALQSYQQALSFDPNEPLAHAGLAEVYYWLGNYSLLPLSEAYTKANSAAERALKLDPNLAEAHAALASVQHNFKWDQVAAEREYQRALDLSSNDAVIRADYAFFLSKLGQHQEALVEVTRAVQSDPLNLRVATIRGGILTFSHRDDEAIAQYKQVLELDADQGEARWYLGLSYAYQRHFDQAIHEMRKLASDDPLDLVHDEIRMIQALSGNKSEAAKRLQFLRKNPKEESVRPTLAAQIFLAVGDKDQALIWLEKACDVHDDWVTFLHVDRFMDPLRPEPRFHAILKRVGLPVR